METVYNSWTSWEQARADLVPLLPERTLEELDGAFHFALHWHGPQVRATGDPYAHHLLEVVEILTRGAGVTDSEILVAAVLHDVLEDTPCPPDRLAGRVRGAHRTDRPRDDQAGRRPSRGPGGGP